jgi:hypothetical protein
MATERMRQLAAQVLIGVRVAFLVGLSAAMVAVSCSHLLRGQEANPIHDVMEEHRLTALESRTDALAQRISDLSGQLWLTMIGIAGLVGERGYQISKTFKQ